MRNIGPHYTVFRAKLHFKYSLFHHKHRPCKNVKLGNFPGKMKNTDTIKSIQTGRQEEDLQGEGEGKYQADMIFLFDTKKLVVTVGGEFTFPSELK